MLKLGALPREPYWIDLSSVAEGLRVKVRPIDPVAMALARREAAEVFSEAEEGDQTANTRAGVGLVRALVRNGIVEWEGVADEKDQPAQVTPDNIDRLLGLCPIYDRLDRDYATPAFTVDTEKNGSSSLPGGTTGTEAPTTAEPAA
ncbi:hypothetical protein [Methylobacterium brachythecii]|uniref:Uncharacterized protein n=1 Tax=Methylobacterium brachythecii TaxID=1176177 RepID=A0A7W6AIW4_9HYPH|nr:hypothetical protein [Methylobacterium brachythecii]MBB3904180.1 hypothetical protein [Methylobacterium brachythecii]GLS45158.1 hypothetical protein GCM10007884_31470 [Methylobacterium brachythecii]